MRATKSQNKSSTKSVGTSAPISAKATGSRKSASGQPPKTTKSASASTYATNRDARTAISLRTPPLIADAVPMRHGVADWRADHADWTQLRADRYRPAWHLAALAFGLKPAEDLEQRLQAARRTDVKKAYGDLIRTLENNLTRVDDSNRLQYVHDETNDSVANDSARRKIDQFVDVAKFVRFTDSRNIIVNEQLWSIANLFVDAAQSTRPAISTVSAMPAANPVPKPAATEPTTSTLKNENESEGGPLSSVEVGTLARILVALAIYHHDYQPSQTLTTEHGTQVKRGTYAPIYKICEELGFKRPSEWETVKSVLLKACNKIGMDEVMSAVGRRQELVRDRSQAK